MFQLMPSTSRGLPCLLRPLIHRPLTVRSIAARPSKTSFSMLPGQISRYSSGSGHSGNDPPSEPLSANAYILSYALGSCLGAAGWSYYFSLPDTTPKMQPTTSVPDEYDQSATPEHTRQELKRQKVLNRYRFDLFCDVEDRCKHFCTQGLVPCPLMQEMHAIYAREIGTDTRSLTGNKSGQSETRTTREELKRLARLGEERCSMFEGLERRCKDLCSDSPRPCSIWQEVQRIHEREMDAQEAEGGESGSLRTRLKLDRWYAEEQENQRS